MDFKNLISLNREEIKLNGDGKTSRIAILKVGTIHDRGLKVTAEMLNDFKANFNAGIYGTEIQVNLGHIREGEAAGWIKELSIQDSVLFADVEWTPLGVEKIASKQYRYTSSELSLSYTHPDTGNKVKNVLIGVALTNIPAVKGMEPVTLAENIQLFLNSENKMNDKAKKMYADLMDKEEVTDKDMSAFADVAGDTEDAVEAKKKLSAKLKKEKKTEKMNEEDENKNAVSLAEFTAEKEKNIKLQERLDRMELNSTVDNTLMLSASVKVGVVPGFKDKLINLMMSLNASQQKELSEIILNGVQGADFKTIGSSENAGDAKGSEDKEIDAADKEAKELSEKTGRPLGECLSEVYAKLDVAKK